jgi:hypothetical protein
VFIEKSKSKLAALNKQLSEQFPDRIDRCRFECDDANEAIKKICARTNWLKSRAVVFLDPLEIKLNGRRWSRSRKHVVQTFGISFPQDSEFIGRFPRRDPRKRRLQNQSRECLGLTIGFGYSPRKQRPPICSANPKPTRDEPLQSTQLPNT